METIHLALASDANYFCGLLVTATSLARHASRAAALVFHVMSDGIPGGEIERLKAALAREHPAVEVVVWPVDSDRFASFPAWNGARHTAYARLLLPELLAAAGYRIGHFLYCDVDFLWTGDVADLWALRSETHALQACADGWEATLALESEWFRANGLAFDPARYICSGLLLVNLALWQRERLTARTLDFLDRHRDVRFADQTAINAVVPEIGLLPGQWGRLALDRTTDLFAEPGAIHFAGCAPWRMHWWTVLATPADDAWYRLYGELNGISASAARRRFVSDRAFCKRRLITLLATTPLVREIFFLLLRVARRGCYIPTLRGVRR